ncbi:Uncharacterised protein [Mycobacteroides abscessus subsp. abscessus]|nr:Uncharacterised protein [Mycobacteroides abscessus subsp. abscessus]
MRLHRLVHHGLALRAVEHLLDQQQAPEARRSQRHQAEEPNDAGRELGIGVWLDSHLVHQPAEHRGVPGFFTHLGQRVAAVIGRSPVLFHHLPPQHGAEPGLDVNTEAQYRSELVAGQLDALLLGQLVPQLGSVQRRAARRRPVQAGHRRGIPVDVDLTVVCPFRRRTQQPLRRLLPISNGLTAYRRGSGLVERPWLVDGRH